MCNHAVVWCSKLLVWLLLLLLVPSACWCSCDGVQTRDMPCACKIRLMTHMRCVLVVLLHPLLAEGRKAAGEGASSTSKLIEDTHQLIVS